MRGPIRTVVVEIALIGAGMFTGLWALLWSLRGSFLTAAIMLSVAVGLTGFAMYFLYTTTLGLARPRTEKVLAGTLLRPSRLVNGMYFVANASVLIAAALFLTFSPLGMVGYVPRGVMRHSIPAACVFLLAFGVPTLIRSVKHGGSARLCLHPDGIDVWDGQFATLRHVNWSEVQQISDRRRKKKPPHEVIVLALPKNLCAVVKADDITGETTALREWVRFYWTHPECRDELVDGRGLQRLADKAL